jgi:mono/diheme cytochrome c family protein
MKRLTSYSIGTVLLLGGLAPGIALAGPGHDGAHAHPATAAHWMAPAAEAERRNPVKADSASRSRGGGLFETHCASCHGAQGRGDGAAGKALVPKPADLAAMAGQHPDGDFAWKIAYGRGPMPGWKAVLRERDIWDLVNFIQGLGTGEGGSPTHGQHHH